MDYKSTIRIGSIIALIVLVIGIFVGRLYSVQITQSEDVLAAPNTYEFLSTVPAARGNILDRNGRVLVSNRASYNLTINNFIIYSKESTNSNILSLVNKCEEFDIEHTDHLPVSRTAPYVSTLTDLSSNWQNCYKTFMAEHEWDLDMTASSLLKTLRETYRIPEDWSDADARKVIGVRYELEVRSYDYSLSTYVLCYDISSDALAGIIELNVPGVNVQTTTVREYNTAYAAHILGSVGKMTAEEYEVYKEHDYAMDASVGKEGFELAFEEYLHGKDGLQRTVLSADGEVIEEYYESEPVSGSNVETTIDISLQMIAEDALASHIESVRENGLPNSEDNDGTAMDAEGGAVVVLSCGDGAEGEVLACASYPTYNLETYSEDFEDLLEDEFAPLYNRALQAIYNPGSTYKMVTGIAAVDYLGFSPLVPIEDKGEYDAYVDEEAGLSFAPKCMIYKNYGVTHDPLDLAHALCVSCNYYFYEMSDRIYQASDGTFDPVDTLAKAMGLGEKTGVELHEEQGYRANAETKATLHEGDIANSGFYAADALMAGIGQSENKFTVLQMATYAGTLANEGTRYRSTFLQRVVSSDYSTLLKQNAPEIVDQVEISSTAMNAIVEGMKLCAHDEMNGTARSTFADYPIEICAKTGTAEHDAGGSSHASFVCFAPADDPEIAIAIYVEKGGSGGALGPIAEKILDAYFAEDTAKEVNYAEGIPN